MWSEIGRGWQVHKSIEDIDFPAETTMTIGKRNQLTNTVRDGIDNCERKRMARSCWTNACSA